MRSIVLATGVVIGLLSTSPVFAGCNAEYITETVTVISNGGGGNSNHDAPKPPYKNTISFKKLEGVIYKDNGKEKHKNKFTFVAGILPERFDLRITVQNKYDSPVDGEIRYYHSDDKEFDPDEDLYLGNDSVHLKGGKTKEENLKRIDVAELFTPGNHYFFANVISPSGDNVSSRHSWDDEYVKVTVLPLVDPPLPPEEPEEDGSYPVYEVEESGYFTRQTINPIDPNVVPIFGYAFATQQSGTVPLFEFNSGTQYFYTATAWEFDYVYTDKGWEYLGVAYYTYPAGSVEGESVWRLWQDPSRTHDWETDLYVKDQCELSSECRVDGVAYQILDPQ